MTIKSGLQLLSLVIACISAEHAGAQEPKCEVKDHCVRRDGWDQNKALSCIKATSSAESAAKSHCGSSGGVNMPVECRFTDVTKIGQYPTQMWKATRDIHVKCGAPK